MLHTFPQKKILAVLLVFSFLLPLSCCAFPDSSNGPVSKTGFYFDTVITVTLYDSDQEPFLDECFSLAENYEKMFSATIDTSDISKINQANGARVAVHDETADLLRKGISYCELSGGRFDITVGTLSSLWDFSDPSAQLPDDREITAALSSIDYQKIQMEKNEVWLTDPETSIDLGGIAKGYIADKMKLFLNENHVTAGTINLGGNVLCIGPKPDGKPYRIGIQKPFDDAGTPCAVVEVTDQTVVSSGIYERYFSIHDKIYHHILNPATGYPYENDLLGVTVICESSADGDGLSTSCFALGLEEGMDLIESLPDTEAVFITQDYELHYSSGMGSVIPCEEL